MQTKLTLDINADEVLNPTPDTLAHVLFMHEIMQGHKIILAYEGDFSHAIIKNVLNMAEKNLEIAGTELQLKKKVFNIMVECLQNVSKHADDEPLANEVTNSSIFMIGKVNETYSIMSGNPVHVMKIDEIKKRIDAINDMSQVQLREEYLKVISSGIVTKQGGAGLGFLDMLRKSGQPLEYNFTKLDDDLYFFALKCNVSAKELEQIN